MGDSEGGVVEHFAMLPPTFSEALDEGGRALAQWGDCDVQCMCRQGGVWFSLCSVYTPDHRRCRLLTIDALCVVKPHSYVDVARGMLYALSQCSFACGSGPAAAYGAKPDAICVQCEGASELTHHLTNASGKWVFNSDRTGSSMTCVLTPASNLPRM